jgi:hypothetical protein
VSIIGRFPHLFPHPLPNTSIYSRNGSDIKSINNAVEQTDPDHTKDTIEQIAITEVTNSSEKLT